MGAQPSEQSVLVFGATGGTGQALIRRAIGANYAVSAFVRDSAKATATLGSMGDSIRLIIGDALDPQSVSAAFTTRPAAVLLSLGMYQSNSTDQTLTQATRNVVTAMQAAHVNRLINISSLGVGDSYQQGNFVARLVQRTTLKHTIADKEQQEKLLRESGLEALRPRQRSPQERLAVVRAAEEIVAATDLPVNADFENGYGAAPDVAAATVRQAAEIGLAGCSIEDTALESGTDAYDFNLTVERAKACVAAARESGIVLTLRADGYMNRAYDEDEAVRRCEAFAEAGADVIYAPLVKPETVKRLARIGPPVNVIGVHKMAAHSVAEIGAMGAARISIGSGLARVTHQAILDAGRAMLAGDLTPLQGAASGDEVDGLLNR